MLHTFHKITGIIIAMAILSGCASGNTEKPISTDPAAVPGGGVESPIMKTTASQPPGATAPIPSETPLTLWVDPAVPEALRDSLTLPEDILLTETETGAALKLRAGEGGNPGAAWVYALAAPFPTLVDDVTLKDIQAAWKGKGSGAFEKTALLMSQATRLAFEKDWGEPATGAVRVMEAGELLSKAWEEMPSWAILPFEEISPRWKIIGVDGISPLDKGFDIEEYPLAVRFSISGPAEQAARVTIQKTNRDADKLTVLVMTGVTALVRATGVRMEKLGMDYPARDIGDWLRDADLTHISNEVSFVSECPPAKPSQENLMFCSRPEYLELLKDVGADIIEQTGNHLVDWRRSALPESLEMYHEAGMLTYGAGETLESARQAVVVEHNGNRFAFLGCNPAGPEMVWATDAIPGAAPCDYEWMKNEIKRLRQEGILPIVTLQYFESYHYTPTPGEQRDFLPLAEAGAVIVSGSQAHYPQGMTFVGDAFIHFGLGNLFFDQMYMPVPGTEADAEVPGTRKEFIDRHVFYDGRYIGTELLTALLEDYSKPRPMTAEEREEMLRAAFDYSPW
jgi:hypothetical protein